MSSKAQATNSIRRSLKTAIHRKFICIGVILASISLSTKSKATVYYWDADAGTSAATGGTGAWDTSSLLWRSGSSTGTLASWPTTGGNNDAFLGGTSGTLTLSTGITVNDITVAPAAGTTYSITGSTLTLAGTVQSVIDVANGDILLINSVLAGTNGFTEIDSGTLILAGTNTYSGVTTISAGTLQIGNGGTTGTLGTGAVTDNGSLVFNLTSSTTVGNAISGTGTLTQLGTGTTILTGANTYSGVTTISAGTLQIGNGGTAGTLGTGTVTDNGALVFNRSDTITVGNVISGTGAITKQGTGTTILTGTNTYSAATTVSAGTLQIGNGTGTGSAIANSASTTVNTGATLAINVANGETFANNVTDNGTVNAITATGKTQTLSGIISGTGVLNQNGAGTTILTGTNTYSGVTTISAGTLQIGNGGTSGTLGTGGVTDNAALIFNRSDTATVANVIGGSGTLTQQGTGTTILTGANTYSGVTTVAAGTLQIGNGTATGSAVANFVPIVVNSGATLAVNLANGETFANNVNDSGTVNGVNGTGKTQTFSGAISGTGALNQSGAGTTILTGANTYSGVTTISAGTLQVGNGGTAGTLGTGNVTDNGSLVFSRADAPTITNVISGTGSVTKLQAAGITLSGANTYSGGTSLVAGNILLGNAAGMGTGTLNIGLGSNSDAGTGYTDGTSGNRNVTAALNTTALTGAVTVANAMVLPADTAITTRTIYAKGGAGNSTNFSGNISGGSTFLSLFLNNDVGDSAGIYRLSGNSTFVTSTGTGANSGINLNRGSLQIDSNAALGNAANTLFINSYAGQKLIFTNPMTYTHPTTLGLATIFDTGANNVDASPAGTITGGFTLTKQGTGTLTVGSTQTYSTNAQLIISQGAVSSVGRLNLNADGTAGNVLISGPGTLNLVSTTSSPTSPEISFNDNDVTGSTANNGTQISAPVNLGAGQHYIWGKTNQRSVSQFGPGSGSTVGADVQFNAPISGTGGLTILAQNSYTGANPMEVPFVLNAANTFTGPVEIQRGSVYLTNANALNQGNALTLDPAAGNNSRFFLYGNNATVSNLTSSGAGASMISNGNLSTGAFLALPAATLTTIQTADTTYGGLLVNAQAEYNKTGTNTQGPLGLTKSGSAILTLTGTNTYTGTTSITDGTLSIPTLAAAGAAQPLGQASSAILLGGTSTTGTLRYTGGTATLARPVTVSSATGSGGVIENSGAGMLTLSGTLAHDARPLTLKSGTMSVTGSITGASANSDLIVDASAVTMLAANTYNGPTYVRNGGTINANVTNAMPTANGRSPVIFDGSGTSTLALGTSQSVASLASTGPATVNLNANTLTVGTTGGSTSFAGSIGGTGNLIKDGTSTQTLAGSNGFTGTTTISSGTLAASGAGALGGTSGIVVNSGGTLLLNGPGNLVKDTAPITDSGGKISMEGVSGHSETVGALTLTAGSVIDFGTGSGNSLFFSGLSSFTGPLAVWNWTGTRYTPGATDPGTDTSQDRLLFDVSTGLSSAQLSQISFYSGSGTGLIGTGAQISFGASDVEIVPVPEPSTIFAACALLGLIGYRERLTAVRRKPRRGRPV